MTQGPEKRKMFGFDTTEWLLQILGKLLLEKALKLVYARWFEKQLKRFYHNWFKSYRVVACRVDDKIISTEHRIMIDIRKDTDILFHYKPKIVAPFFRMFYTLKIKMSQARSVYLEVRMKILNLNSSTWKSTRAL